MSISQGFGDVRSRARQGVVGDWVYSDSTRRSSHGINSTPQASQTGTILVDTATNSATYTWTVNGVVLTYVADSATSKIEIAAGIALAINAEPLVRGQVSAVSDGIDTVTMTGVTPGVAFTASDSDAKLTTTETVIAADTADAIEFGRVVIHDGFNTSESERLVVVADTTQFSAQVATLSIAYVAAALVTVTVFEIRGSERFELASVTETSAVDRDTTIDALVANLNALLPATSVLAAADAGTATAIVFTAEILGLEFAIEYSANDAGASIPAISLTATTGPSVSTSIHRAFAGVSLYSPADEAATVAGTAGSYAGNAGVSYAVRGVVWVLSAEAPVNGAAVFVELAAGATAGRMYAVASATRVALSRAIARWERDGLVSADSLAAVRLEA